MAPVQDLYLKSIIYTYHFDVQSFLSLLGYNQLESQLRLFQINSLQTGYNNDVQINLIYKLKIVQINSLKGRFRDLTVTGTPNFH